MRITPHSMAAATVNQPVNSRKMVNAGLIRASFAQNGHTHFVMDSLVLGMFQAIDQRSCWTN